MLISRLAISLSEVFPRSWHKLLILLFLSNRRVIYTSFILKDLSYFYIDTKLFDVGSILVTDLDTLQLSTYVFIVYIHIKYMMTVYRFKLHFNGQV